jgi:GPH family glycoside/pentoside/hexuronide:cation symporter
MNPPQTEPNQPSFDSFPWTYGLVFLLAVAAVQISLEYISQYGPYFLFPPEGTNRPAFVALGLVGVAFAVARLIDAVSDPLVGIWSDRLNTRPRRFPWIAGRRRPFLFWASIPLLATSVLFWFPPTQGVSQSNFLYCLLILALQLIFLTCCAIPLYALGPELARTPASRVRLGAWTGAGTTLGVVIAIVVAGPLVSTLDPARLAEDDTAAFSAVGYQRVSWLFGLLVLLAFQLLVWVVKEDKPAEPMPAESTSTHALSDLRRALLNPRFLLYFAIFFLFNVGFLAPQRCLPHWVEVGLGGDEAMVGEVMWPFFVTSLIASLAAPACSRLLSAKWLMVLGMAMVTVSLPWMHPIASSAAPSTTKVLWAQLMFATSGFGNGLLYVIVFPILGEIIDDDARGRSGRHEAMFLALHTMTWKAGVTVSVLLATQVMAWLGASIENPAGIFWVGPVAGLFCFVALLMALFYPSPKR